MDRRTLLAFALIGAIIFLMPYYYRWISGEPLEEVSTWEPAEPSLQVPEPDSYSSTPQPTSLPVETHNSTKPTLPQTFIPLQLIIETDRYIATLSTRGGRVTSWRLKDYVDEFGQWLELIEPESGGLSVVQNGRLLDDVEFSTTQTDVQISGREQQEITLTARFENRLITKRFLFQGNRYRIELTLDAQGFSTGDRLGVGWDRFLADTEGDGGEQGGFGGFEYDQVVTSAGAEVETWGLESIADREVPRPSGRIEWVTVRGKYFLSSIIPQKGLLYDIELQAPGSGPGSQVAMVHTQYPGDPLSFGVYIGPLSHRILQNQNKDLYGRETTINLDEVVRFGWVFWSILKPATLLVIHAFTALQNVIPNYGFVIIVFSVLVKIVLFPLTRKSTEATAKMQELQPQISALKEKYSDNSEKMNQEMMKLYRDQKVNPLGGCLPLFLQAPILFSLFNVFRNAIELRQARFGLWIEDLSKPDSLMIAGFDLHVLPLIMAGSMFVQQKLTMKDPKQAALVYIMPVFMIWIFWSMSSGLVLYFTMYNLLSVFEQQLVKKSPAQPQT